MNNAFRDCIKEYWKPCLFLMLFPLVWYSTPLFTDKSYFFDDFNAQYRPWWTYAQQRLCNGEFPLWNPHVFGGMPYYTNPETSLFYPVKILFARLPFEHAAPLVLLFNAIIGSLGMLTLLRSYKLKVFPATIGALLFTYGSFMSYEVHIPYVNTVVWFPWQMFIIKRMLYKPDIRKSLLLSIVTAAAFLGGSPEIFFMTTLTLAGLSAFILLQMIQNSEWPKIKLFLCFAFLSVAVVIALTAVGLFPVAEFNSMSIKSDGYSDPYALKRVFFRDNGMKPLLFPYLHQLFGAPYPPIFTLFFKIEPFVGSAAVLLSFLIICTRRYRAFAAVALLMFVFSIAMSMGTNKGFFPWIFTNCGVFRFFQWPQNYIVITYILLSITSAMGLDILWRGAFDDLKKFYIIGSIYLIAGYLWIPHSLSLAYLTGGVSAFAGLYLYTKRKERRPDGENPRCAFGSIILLFVIAELFLFAFTYRVYLPEDILSVRHYSSVMDFIKRNTAYERTAFSATQLEVYFKDQQGYLNEPIPLAYDLPDNIRHVGHIDRLHRKWDSLNISNSTWERRNAYIHNYDWSFEYPVNNSMIFNYYEISGYNSFRLKRIKAFFRNVPFRKTLNMFNTKWFVTSQRIIQKDMMLAFSANGLHTYYNHQALPRVIIPAIIRDGLKPDAMLNIIASPEFNPENELLLEVTLPEEIRNTHPSGSAEITKYEPETVKIQLNMTSPGMIALHDIYYPGWEADLDGGKTEIHKANYLFRAVHVPEGEHELTFRFKPKIFRISAAISVLSWLICSIILSVLSLKAFIARQHV